MIPCAQLRQTETNSTRMSVRSNPATSNVENQEDGSNSCGGQATHRGLIPRARVKVRFVYLVQGIK